MLEYLWRSRRDEYSWHFEAASFSSKLNTKTDIHGGGFREDDVFAKRVPIKTGSPGENGVTKEMLKPFPRVAVHAGYLFKKYSGFKMERRIITVRNYMQRGFCFSLPYDAIGEPCRCGRFNVSTEINIQSEWFFQRDLGNRWAKYNLAGAKQAHKERVERNIPHAWDAKEMYRLFEDFDCSVAEPIVFSATLQ
jgi:hypothetical protein